MATKPFPELSHTFRAASNEGFRSFIFIPYGDAGERELAKLEQEAEELKKPPRAGH